MLGKLWQERIPTRRRSANEHPLQWLVDAMFALILIVIGSVFAGMLTAIMPFLGKLAYPTALFISWFPTLLWMHYCRVGFNGIRTTKPAIIFTAIFYLWVISTTVIIDVIENGTNIIWQIPVSAFIIAIALPIETLIGKLILSRLPNSNKTSAQHHVTHTENAT